MSSVLADLRAAIDWSPHYRQEWDESPSEYEKRGVVDWGRSRRLGMYRHGSIKAYLGVQHVDTDKAGWSIAGAPYSRFFVSLFAHRVCLTLRTFPTMGECLQFLAYSRGKIA